MALMLACGLVVVGRVEVARGQGCTANEFQKLLDSDGGVGDFFGLSVSISGDVALVGAYLDDDKGTDSGSAIVFRFDGTRWTQQAKLLAYDGAATDYFGFSVSLDGDVAIVGAVGDDNENGQRAGSAYVFRFDGSNWNREAKLLASHGAARDQFGRSVSINGDVALVGARDDDDNDTDSGSAFIFRFDGTGWNQEARLLASDGAGGDNFGSSVSISSDVAIVGMPPDSNSNGAGAGSAYIFRFDGSNWNQEAKLLASDGAGGDLFGYSVSIDDDVVLVGSLYDDDNGFKSGSAYIFRFEGSNWNQEAKLLPSDGAANDQFGFSVSISRDVAVVGAFWDDDNGTDAGSAYIFRLDGTTWNQQVKLLASDGAADDQFGYSVSIDGDVALVAAVLDNGNGTDSGSVYFFAGVGDCNDNGAADICDIADGTSQDENGNGIPDECDGSACDGDEVFTAKCKTRGCTTTLTGALKNGTPGGLVTFQLDGDSCTDKRIRVKGNGKAKVKYKALSAIFASRQYTIEVVECDVSATTECP